MGSQATVDVPCTVKASAPDSCDCGSGSYLVRGDRSVAATAVSPARSARVRGWVAAGPGFPRRCLASALACALRPPRPRRECAPRRPRPGALTRFAAASASAWALAARAASASERARASSACASCLTVAASAVVGCSVSTLVAETVRRLPAPPQVPARAGRLPRLGGTEARATPSATRRLPRWPPRPPRRLPRVGLPSARRSGGAGGAGRCGLAVPDTRYTRIGREMFFRVCSPIS